MTVRVVLLLDLDLRADSLEWRVSDGRIVGFEMFNSNSRYSWVHMMRAGVVRASTRRVGLNRREGVQRLWVLS